MNRKSWHELLAQYLTGMLSPDDRAEFDRCLQDNETCRDELREWRVIAAAVKQDADARVEHVPPLPAAFYERLGVQPSANGSLRHAMTDMEESMTSLVGSKSKEKQKRAQGRPVTLAAALGALLLGGLVLLSGRGGRLPEVPLAGVIGQDTTPVPEVDMNSLYLTATALIVEATETKMALDASPTPTPTDTLAPVVPTLVPVVTATPLAVQAIEVQPTVVPPVSSGMQPIVAAPARLAGEAEVNGGIYEGGVVVSGDGAYVAVQNDSHAVQVFAADTLELAATIDLPETAVTKVAFGGSRLAIGTGAGDVLLWSSGEPQTATLEGDGWVTGLAFSADGQHLAVIRGAGAINTLWLYDLETGRQSAVMVYDVPLAGAAFSPDGSQVIVGTLDGRVLMLALGGE